MGLLRKYRRRQPINGVIITISISDLLTQSAEASRQQAVNLRQRLSELHEQLGIRFPVYVMVTKADLLKGFRAWFADYDKAQRDQIWGFTLPWEQTKHADYDLMGNFQQEFSLLQQRLDAGLPETMLKEHDAKTRAEAYLFPQEFAALRPLLADYLSTVFARSNFETEFSPRGIYFASGTQEGMPFDRVMGELNRALSLPEGERAITGIRSAKKRRSRGKRPEFLHQEPAAKRHLPGSRDRRRKPLVGAAQPGGDLVRLCGAAGPAGDPRRTVADQLCQKQGLSGRGGCEGAAAGPAEQSLTEPDPA
jgi:type VI protein secretion system component VasK